jgi:hypothetical protein
MAPMMNAANPDFLSIFKISHLFDAAAARGLLA